METKALDTLNPNPKNPRTMSKHDADALAKSMKEFGDLSPITFNEQTQQLVGGHQRINILRHVLKGGEVYITQRFDNPDSVGTVALGYVIFDGKQFAYRAVSWDLPRELAANIASNRIQGAFQLDLLAEVNYMIKEANEALLGLTGQTDDEIAKLLGDVAPEEPEEKPADENERLEFSLTKEQVEIVEEALGHIKANREMATEKNSSMNGNALYYMSKDYLDKLHNQAPTVWKKKNYKQHCLRSLQLQAD